MTRMAGYYPLLYFISVVPLVTVSEFGTFFQCTPSMRCERVKIVKKFAYFVQ